MNIPALFLVALPLLGSGVRTDVAAGAGLEVRAGLLPLPGDQTSSEFGTETTLTPLAGIRRTTALTGLQLTYQPRLHLRLPSVIMDNRVLVFNAMSGALSARLTPRWSTFANASVGVGELSYADFNLIFDPGTSSTIEALIPLFRVSGVAGASYLTSIRQTTTLSVSGGMREFIGESEPSDQTQFLPSSANLGANAQHSYRLNPAESLSGAFSFGSIWTQNRETMTFSATGGYSRVVAEDSSLELRLGANYAYQPDVRRASELFPTGTLSYSTRWRDSGLNWTLTSSGGVSGFFDEVIAEYRPQLALSAGLGVAGQRRWNGGLNASLGLPLTETAVNENRLETQLSLNAPFSVNLGRGFRLGAGGRCSFRAPHPSLITVDNIRVDLSASVNLQYRIGTGPLRGSWL